MKPEGCIAKYGADCGCPRCRALIAEFIGYETCSVCGQIVRVLKCQDPPEPYFDLHRVVPEGFDPCAGVELNYPFGGCPAGGMPVAADREEMIVWMGPDRMARAEELKRLLGEER